MITAALILAGLVVIMFGFVLMFGAPYLPTLKAQKQTAFELLDLKPGQTMLELGSGDGRMLVLAAEKGIKSIGFEINPILFLFSKLITWRHRDMISIRMTSFWTRKLPECEGIYVFLLDKYMTKLNKKITQDLDKPVKVVSFAFKIPDKKHITEKSGLYLYTFHNK